MINFTLVCMHMNVIHYRDGTYYYVIVAVHAQVVCRASTDCNGAPGDDLGVMTIKECCLNTPNSLAFSEGEFCTPCIGECMHLCIAR